MFEELVRLLKTTSSNNLLSSLIPESTGINTKLLYETWLPIFRGGFSHFERFTSIEFPPTPEIEYMLQHAEDPIIRIILERAEFNVMRASYPTRILALPDNLSEKLRVGISSNILQRTIGSIGYESTTKDKKEISFETILCWKNFIESEIDSLLDKPDIHKLLKLQLVPCDHQFFKDNIHIVRTGGTYLSGYGYLSREILISLISSLKDVEVQKSLTFSSDNTAKILALCIPWTSEKLKIDAIRLLSKRRSLPSGFILKYPLGKDLLLKKIKPKMLFRFLSIVSANVYPRYRNPNHVVLNMFSFLKNISSEELGDRLIKLLVDRKTHEEVKNLVNTIKKEKEKNTTEENTTEENTIEEKVLSMDQIINNRQILYTIEDKYKNSLTEREIRALQALVCLSLSNKWEHAEEVKPLLISAIKLHKLKDRGWLCSCLGS